MTIWTGWENLFAAIWAWLVSVGAKLGLGGGVGLLAFLLYLQPPRIDANPLLRTLFDALMHLIGNGRSGERRLPDGTITWVVKARRPAPEEKKPEEKKTDV